MARSEHNQNQEEGALQERLDTATELIDLTLKRLAAVPEFTTALLQAYLHRCILGQYDQSVLNLSSGDPIRFTHRGGEYSLEYYSTPGDTRLFLKKGSVLNEAAGNIETITLYLSHERYLIAPKMSGFFHYWLQTYNHRSDIGSLNDDRAKLYIQTFLETNFPED